MSQELPTKIASTYELLAAAEIAARIDAENQLTAQEMAMLEWRGTHLLTPITSFDAMGARDGKIIVRARTLLVMRDSLMVSVTLDVPTASWLALPTIEQWEERARVAAGIIELEMLANGHEWKLGEEG